VPHRLAADLAELIVALRRAHPTRAAQAAALLQRRHPGLAVPAASTIGDLFAAGGIGGAASAAASAGAAGFALCGG
jgi:hypothetical protein